MLSFANVWRWGGSASHLAADGEDHLCESFPLRRSNINSLRLRAILLAGLIGVLNVLSASGQQPESGKVFEAAGASIYYEVRGSGAAAPLVVVNGGPGFDHTYLHCSAAWDELAKRRPVLFYDQRGNGRSGALKKDQTCTLADQLAD